MNLFQPKVSEDKLHPVFKLILHERYEAERALLQRWADRFVDRDGKFVQEFQTTFESSLWELYLSEALREWRLPVDMSHHAPDFVVGGQHPFGLEATIAAPPAGGKPAHGYSVEDCPDDFTQFNIQSTLRICNSFDAKVKRHRKYYSNLSHMSDRAFVIGIAAFDRPLAHFSASRPIVAALYGLYYDEAATSPGAKKVTSYNVSSAPKNENTDIDVGLFCDDTYSDVAAVIYSSLVTWGKVRALADNPNAMTVYTTFHPAEDQLRANVRTALKRDYSEHLLDGLYVFHNPFARQPLPPTVFDHPRITQMTMAPDGELLGVGPRDFLLARMLNSVIEQEN